MFIDQELPHPRQPDQHDHEHPDDARNLALAVILLGQTPPCPSCGRAPELIAGPGPEWVVDQPHHSGCPDDDVPYVEAVFLEDEDSPRLHAEAEAIWQAGDADQ